MCTPGQTRSSSPRAMTSRTLTSVEQIQDVILESADFEAFLNELARYSSHQVAGEGDDALWHHLAPPSTTPAAIPGKSRRPSGWNLMGGNDVRTHFREPGQVQAG